MPQKQRTQVTMVLAIVAYHLLLDEQMRKYSKLLGKMRVRRPFMCWYSFWFRLACILSAYSFYIYLFFKNIYIYFFSFYFFHYICGGVNIFFFVIIDVDVTGLIFNFLSILILLVVVCLSVAILSFIKCHCTKLAVTAFVSYNLSMVIIDDISYPRL